MRLSLLSILLFSIITSSAQEDNNLNQTLKKHEVRLNVLSFVAFKKIDVSYEYRFNNSISSGLSVLTKYGSNRNFDFFYVQDYAITPYFRYQFLYPILFYSETIMTAEVFTMVHGGTYYPNSNMKKGVEFQDIAIGFSVGTKFISDDGFVLSSNVGAGRNMKNKTNNELVLRLGISFGYQF